MNIGDASKTSRVPAKMIRYHEQIGLIPAAHRNLGFSVAETKDLPSLRNAWPNWTGVSRAFGNRPKRIG
ncbi:MerR family DNA-binding transcriptional regulator [Achromobacter insolitus]|uniref:MerR family DNA-binding transcriptional regulator n=1 Tax=Achromobacter insolitus TaxID=217204 RepID=UPI003558247C